MKLSNKVKFRIATWFPILWGITDFSVMMYLGDDSLGYWLNHWIILVLLHLLSITSIIVGLNLVEKVIPQEATGIGCIYLILFLYNLAMLFVIWMWKNMTLPNDFSFG